MGIMSLVGWIFGAGAAAPPDAMKLDGTTEATLARSLSTLSPGERAWITFVEARILFSTKGAQYAFGETDQDGRRTSNCSRRSTGPSSTSCRSRGGSISARRSADDARQYAPPRGTELDCVLPHTSRVTTSLNQGCDVGLTRDRFDQLLQINWN